MEESINDFTRQDGKDVLIPLHPVWNIQRINATLQGLFPRQGIYCHCQRPAQPLGQSAPVCSITNAEMPDIAPEELVGSLSDERHLHILTSPFADKVHGNNGRGGNRFFQKGYYFRQGSFESLSIKMDRYVPC